MTISAGRYFLENGAAFADDQRAPYAVLPVPYERTTSFGRGTAAAPAAILSASVQLELFDEEFFCAPELAVRTLPAVDCAAGASAQAVLARIEEIAAVEFNAGYFLLSLGGEHTISAPLIAAAQRVYPGLAVLHLDAHLDLRDQYEGTSFSHACAMRRVWERGVPIVHCGIRSLCAEEYDFIGRHQSPVFWARDIVGASTTAWIGDLLARLADPVYLTLDVDALDPAVMPGTGTPEPGGLSWAATLALLRQLFQTRRVIGADIVEAVPLPPAVTTEYTAARLAAKILTYHKLAAKTKKAVSPDQNGGAK